MEKLAEIYGQEAAIRALRRALQAGQLPGAYLFVGQPGVGRGATARAFARAACCLNPEREPFDSCGICESCRRMDSGTQPEIVTVAPAGEQMQIWQFWDRDNRPPGILTHSLPYAPNIGRKRVYLLENAETLTESAANSLLKVLEETPPYALFILASMHPARVLPTIVSRCQVIRLRALPAAELNDYLIRTHGVAPEKAAMISAFSEGRIGQAIRLVGNSMIGEEIGRVLDLAEALPQAPRVRALRLAEQMRKLATQIKTLAEEESPVESGEDDAGSPKDRAGRRQLAIIFDLLTSFYRDLFALSVCGEQAMLVHGDRADRLVRQAQYGSAERWRHCLDALLLARRRLDAKANVALVTEALVMTLLST